MTTSRLNSALTQEAEEQRRTAVDAQAMAVDLEAGLSSARQVRLTGSSHLKQASTGPGIRQVQDYYLLYWKHAQVLLFEQGSTSPNQVEEAHMYRPSLLIFAI